MMMRYVSKVAVTGCVLRKVVCQSEVHSIVLNSCQSGTSHSFRETPGSMYAVYSVSDPSESSLGACSVGGYSLGA